MIMVDVPINNKYVEIPLEKNIASCRIIKYTPAVTRVEEWTKEDTGVGAAIAAGSQAEKGIWALFVQAAIISNNPNPKKILLFL